MIRREGETAQMDFMHRVMTGQTFVSIPTEW
jgi:hypothetical protein